jgi:hypothetical protein
MNRKIFSFAIGSFVFATAIAISATSASHLRFEISFPATSSTKPPDGRMLARAFSRLRYHQMFMSHAVERMLKTAPAGANLKS